MLIKCPECDVEIESTDLQAQTAHMQEAHPELMPKKWKTQEELDEDLDKSETEGEQEGEDVSGDEGGDNNATS